MLPVIEAINDGARLLAEVHHLQSVSRQGLISLGLDKGVKDLIQSTQLDGWLFGKELGDRFKAVKAIQKSGQELRGPKRIVSKPKVSVPKNRQGPPRQQVALGGSQTSGARRTNSNQGNFVHQKKSAVHDMRRYRQYPH